MLSKCQEKIPKEKQMMHVQRAQPLAVPPARKPFRSELRDILIVGIILLRIVSARPFSVNGLGSGVHGGV
jgi:hypothetical protein